MIYAGFYGYYGYYGYYNICWATFMGQVHVGRRGGRGEGEINLKKRL